MTTHHGETTIKKNRNKSSPQYVKPKEDLHHCIKPYICTFLSRETRLPVEITRPDSSNPTFWNNFPGNLEIFFTEMSSRVTASSSGTSATSRTSFRKIWDLREPDSRTPSHLKMKNKFSYDVSQVKLSLLNYSQVHWLCQVRLGILLWLLMSFKNRTSI